MNKSDIIEKIKKLLEINRANGATEAEEAAAMERANVLMTKYQIEEFQLKGTIKTKNMKSSDILDDKSFSFSQFRCAVGEFFGVLSLFSTTTYGFYGAQDNVQLAKEMTKRSVASLSLAFTEYLCSDEYRKNRKQSGRKKVKDSFHDGFYIKIAARLEKLVDDRAAATKKATGTDLVVLNEENLGNAYEDDFGYKLKTGRTRKQRDTDPHAFFAGMEKGDEFRILERYHMKTIKTDNAKIKIEIVSFNEQGERYVIVRTEDNQKDPTVIVLPASIVKSKFTDAAFIRHITNFLIKD